jgi:hypothetical protein
MIHIEIPVLNSGYECAGEAPAAEEPVKPFGMERFPTVEEELGYRQPFTAKEREISHHTIQVPTRLFTFLPIQCCLLFFRLQLGMPSGMQIRKNQNIFGSNPAGGVSGKFR